MHSVTVRNRRYYTGKEYHHNSPPLTKLLHKALREKDIDSYKLFQESLKTAPLSTLRDLLDIKSDRQPIAVEKVCYLFGWIVISNVSSLPAVCDSSTSKLYASFTLYL